MYALRFTLFAPSLASAAGAVVKQQAASLARCHPVKLSSAGRVACLRGFASESGSRASLLRRIKSTTLKERLMALAGESGQFMFIFNFFLFGGDE